MQEMREILDCPVNEDGNLPPDTQGMQLFLSKEFCSRGVLSQFLDQKLDWRWCMEGEVPCSVCQCGHAEVRPAGLEFQLSQEAVDVTTGPEEVFRQDHMKDEALSRYEQDLKLMLGLCLYCCTMQRPFVHNVNTCAMGFKWIRAKDDARTKGRHGWIAPGSATGQIPSTRMTSANSLTWSCLCVIFARPGAAGWLKRHFQRGFKDVPQYMAWLGEVASLEGNKCIQANCVAALVLAEFG
ncbi:hypothetical protein VC83_09198 [Pseudogymnoascus destructans]|uniref:Uncharacterized protein n=1 Tax=Pseudogymnoascus destructans TaxID=655981 RepID=A0A176ZXD1_9PEZI|nr:uncharacterized protein VC83_09198 [Pseudogymnoascus destructans]OAF54538.1 hypothetical protein VC83_09198 [Pseudogymnoascus destructans]